MTLTTARPSAPRADVGDSGARPAAVTSRRSGNRAEIQGLRALAVALVVVYHFWPARLPGGYVGVDVFFVISGFLITQHLLREMVGTGRVRLLAFWARRARRLLPAALLVLAATAGGVLLLLPPSAWEAALDEIRAAALYGENWYLIGKSVDYLTASTPSATEHFWSLSTEEQFYLAWPVLLALAALVASRFHRLTGRQAALVGIGVVTGASLLWSVHEARTGAGGAYFATPVRAWEFGAGGLLAIAGTGRIERSRHLAASLAWLGLLGIAVSALHFDAGTPFPGYHALVPVLATVAVIAAGTSTAPWGPDRLHRLRITRLLGDHSYSLYLWHLPTLVLLTAALPVAAAWVKGLALLAALLLAAGTKALVEDPVRRGRLTRLPVRFTYFVALVAMGAVLALASGGIGFLHWATARSAAQAAAVVHAHGDCLGAGSIANDCSYPLAAPVPDRFALPGDVAAGFRCFHGFGVDPAYCSYPAPAPEAARIAVVGDSHAAMLLPGLRAQASARHWRIDTFTNGGCVWGDFRNDTRCTNRAGLDGRLRAGHYDVVVVAASRAADGGSSETLLHTPDDPRVPELSRTWSALLRTGTRVVAVQDNPRMTAAVVACAAGPEPAQCGLPAARALHANDPVLLAAERTPGVTLIRTEQFFCRDAWCPAVIGGVQVYWDEQHITGTYSTTLGPVLAARIAGVLADAGRRG